MPHIHLTYQHNLGLDQAKARIEDLVQQLKDRLDVNYHWKGNEVEFSRTGATGTILVEDKSVTTDVELGLMLAAFKGEIEKQLKSFFDRQLQ